MPTTVNGVTVPTSGDAPDVPAAFLAAIGSLIGDPVTSGVANDAADGQVTGQWMQQFGPWALIALQVKYTGTTDTTNSNGSFAPKDVASLTWGSIPGPAWLPINATSDLANGNMMWNVQIKGGGGLSLRGGLPSVTLTQNDLINIYGLVPK